MFLAAQAIAFDAMTRAGHAGRLVPRDTLADLAARADADLARLDHGRPAAPAAGPADAMAVDYVVLGSRLGSKMLRRIWAAGTDPRARAASAYFEGPDMAAEWRAFCDDAGTRPADDAAADRTVASARALFGLFDAALDAVQAQNARDAEDTAFAPADVATLPRRAASRRTRR